MTIVIDNNQYKYQLKQTPVTEKNVHLVCNGRLITNLENKFVKTLCHLIFTSSSNMLHLSPESCKSNGLIRCSKSLLEILKLIKPNLDHWETPHGSN